MQQLIRTQTKTEYRTLRDFYENRDTISVAVNDCRAKQDWPGTAMLFWKGLVSLLVTLPLYWAMVTAFHLLNLPSDRAVLGGRVPVAGDSGGWLCCV